MLISIGLRVRKFAEIVFNMHLQGLYGATHLAEVFANRSEPLYAMLNNDIVGSSGPSSGTEKYGAFCSNFFAKKRAAFITTQRNGAHASRMLAYVTNVYSIFKLYMGIG